jgi:hypothetical protein
MRLCNAVQLSIIPTSISETALYVQGLSTLYCSRILFTLQFKIHVAPQRMDVIKHTTQDSNSDLFIISA